MIQNSEPTPHKTQQKACLNTPVQQKNYTRNPLEAYKHRKHTEKTTGTIRIRHRCQYINPQTDPVRVRRAREL